MPSKYIRAEGGLYNFDGARVLQKSDDDAKMYAVIAKCGHCGDGYFIPIMFTIFAPDLHTAISYIKTYPKVQRDRKDVILAAFELSLFEKLFIDAINNHDPYIRGYTTKTENDIIERRVANFSPNDYKKGEKSGDNMYDGIKTSDQYQDKYVLERVFSPHVVGSDMFVPNTVDKNELLQEFFKQNTYRYGIRGSDTFFLSLYYQMHGENNDLGIKLDGNYFHYPKDGKMRTRLIPELFLQKMKENVDMVPKIPEQKEDMIKMLEEMEYSPNVNMIEKFNAKLNKYKAMQEDIFES